LKIIGKYGDILATDIVTKDGKVYSFEEYRKSIDCDVHRNGNYLTIRGQFKGL